MIKKMLPRGVYVHIPFCRRKCLYCDFPSIPCGDENLMLAYARGVCREIRERGAAAVPHATVFFGGGTPSILPLQGLEQIVQTLKETGLWQEPAEATIECNPGTVTLAGLRVYRELGFDRISFGVQSFQNEELRSVGRIHNREQAGEAVNWAQEAGFKRINLDLISGLPGQTAETWADNLKRALALGTEHLSLYSLILEEGTPLAALASSGKVQLPGEEELAAMDMVTAEITGTAGMERYEISNYSRPGAESRHNLVYWSYLPYLGFGAAATSFDGFQRRIGVCDVQEYLANSLACEEEKLSLANLYSEFMFMNLRKTAGVNLNEFQDRYGADIVAKTLKIGEPLLKQGLVVYDNKAQNLRLTERGRDLGNLVFEAFI